MNNIEFIKNFCEKYYITNYTINDDLSIDVDGNVDIGYTPTKKSIYILDEIPIKFNKVRGYFDCSNNNLSSLKNCPTYVGKNFSCDENNNLSSKYESKAKNTELSPNPCVAKKSLESSARSAEYSIFRFLLFSTQ